MNTKTLLILSALLGLTFLASGCVTKRQSMPAVNILCSVFDATSKEPIIGARVFMTYRGPNGERVKKGPFLTDNRGRSAVSIPEETLRVSGMDAYFVGGYLRAIEVEAEGYEGGSFDEGFEVGLIERKAPLEFFMRVKKMPNQALQPTSLSVTPPAVAGVAPVGLVAHL